MSGGEQSVVGAIILRAFAMVLLALGFTLAAGGFQLLILGGSAYYSTCGLAVCASGVLLFLRRSEGALVYGLVISATIVWAIWEVGDDGWALMPRVVALVVSGMVLLIPAVHRSLLGRARPSLGQIAGLATFAIVLGAVLRALIPPLIPIDPLYQTGMSIDGTKAVPVRQAADTNGTDWLHYGNDAGGTRFSPLSQISAANVTQLKLAWTFNVGKTGNRLETTPLEVDGTLFICTGTNDLVALDAETGKQIWRFDAHAKPATPWSVCRGVAYFRIPDASGPCAERIVTNTIDARLIAVDAHDGRLCTAFGKDGQVSLMNGMGEVLSAGYYYVTSAPTIVRNNIVVGGWVADNQYWGEPSGVIRAFDALTGKLAWAWDMGHPDRTGEPPPGETYTPSTPNAWGPMSADETLGVVYVPLSNPTPDFFGGQRRPFDEKYNDALVALDALTGRLRWSFQTLHHDLWDLDIPAQPTLVDVPSAHGIVPAVIQATKRGEVFVLDRASGASLLAIEERPVPQRGAVPEEHLAPTQPFVVGMPSFRGAKLVEGDMWGITPLDQLWCRIKFREARYDGDFMPPGLTPAIATPGSGGGIEWGGVAVDTTRHIILINSNLWPIYSQLIPRAEADRMGLKPFNKENSGEPFAPNQPQANTPYGARANIMFLSPLNVPCKRPPFGRLSAVDLTTGKLIWTRVFGSARDLGPLGLRSHLPFDLGTFNLGGGVATESGLFFIGATQDRRFRAYETTNGKLAWEQSLPGGGFATPITYISQASGRQFVVIAASGADGIHPPQDDYIVAYALPITPSNN
jgi:quinoprotein glucose dehydrogenase